MGDITAIGGVWPFATTIVSVFPSLGQEVIAKLAAGKKKLVAYPTPHAKAADGENEHDT